MIGERTRNGFTIVSNELIRVGGHNTALGSDGLLVMTYLLSCATALGANQRPWETSVRAIAEHYGIGRDRVRAALDRAVKDSRLVIRGYLIDGQLAPNRSMYVVCHGGRQFTDEELLAWSTPLEIESSRRGGAK